MDGWMEGKAGLRIAYSNQKLFYKTNIILKMNKNNNFNFNYTYSPVFLICMCSCVSALSMAQIMNKDIK